MTQEFNKPVGQAVQAENADIHDQSRTIHIHGNTVAGDFAAGDIHNHHVFNAVGNEDLDEDRRQQLSRRAAALEAKYGFEKWKARRLVNEIVGVTSQDVMQARHFQPASKVYDLLFQIEELKQQVQEGVRSRDAANDPGSQVAIQRLRQQLNDSATAIAKQTESNSKLSADLKQAQDIRTRVESQYAKALQQIEMLRAHSQALDRVTTERDRLAGTARDLRQQTGQLEAHLQSASQRLVATRRKVSIVSFGLAAAALACIYLTHRLLSVESSVPPRQVATPPSATNAVAPHRATPARHHVTAHHSTMKLLPPGVGQLPPMGDIPSEVDGQAPVDQQQSDN